MIEAAVNGDAKTIGGALVKRHRVSTRIWHWTNAIAIFVMLMSGLMIFNAHPRLYWGQYGANLDKPWLVLPRFPGWATLPSDYNLALGRHWQPERPWPSPIKKRSSWRANW